MRLGFVPPMASAARGGGPGPGGRSVWPPSARTERDAGGTETETEGEREHFAFRFAPAYRWAALLFGVTPARSAVTVDRAELRATFGPWRVDTPLSNIDRVELTGPYHFLKTAGPARLSLADGGVTFATNRHRGVLVTFRQPITGAEPLGRLHSPNLTVTVEDCPLLAASLISRTS